MDAIYFLMNYLNNNFKNIIGLKSDQEHMIEYQISILLIIKEVSQFKKH